MNIIKPGDEVTIRKLAVRAESEPFDKFNTFVGIFLSTEKIKDQEGRVFYKAFIQPSFECEEHEKKHEVHIHDIGPNKKNKFDCGDTVFQKNNVIKSKNKWYINSFNCFSKIKDSTIEQDYEYELRHFVYPQILSSAYENNINTTSILLLEKIKIKNIKYHYLFPSLDDFAD